MSAEPINPFIATAPVNPFMEGDTSPNPFIDLAVQQRATALQKNRRKLRPNGEPYSSDARIRMAQLREDGKVGPQFGHLGGASARRNKRAAEVVKEAAAEHAEDIKRVFLDGIDESNPIGIRMQAAKEILKVEGDEFDRELSVRRQEFEEMGKAELVAHISDALNRLGRAGQIAAEISRFTETDIIDVNGEVVDRY